MPKPTLLQKVLGRPSQSYSAPPQKDYHSTKQDLIRVAATAGHFPQEAPFHPGTAPASSYHAASRHTSIYAQSLSSQPLLSPNPPLSSSKRTSSLRKHARSRTLHASPLAPEPELVSIPEPTSSRSLIRQIASSRSLTPSSFHENGTGAVPSPYISSAQPSAADPSDRRSVELPVVEPAGAGSSGSSPSPDSESDRFYTPRSSPPSVPSLAESDMLLEPQALATALLPIRGRSTLKASLAPPELSRHPYEDDDPGAAAAVTPGPPSRASSEVDADVDGRSAPVSRSASDSSLSSSAASERDSASLFDCAATTSTRLTTPAGSEDGPAKSDEDASELSSSQQHTGDDERSPPTAEVITIISSSTLRRPRPPSIDLSPSSLAPRNTERVAPRHSQPARTDEDWARDVRWLVPPLLSAPISPSRPKAPAPATHSPSPRRRARPLHPDLLPPPPSSPGGFPNLPAPHQLDRQPFADIPGPAAAPIPVARPRPVRPRAPKEHRSSRHSQRRSRSRMSALWEEDESECSTDVGASSAEVSRASTPALMAGAGVEGYMSVPMYGEPGGGGSPGPAHAGMRFLSSVMQRRASMSESELLQQMQADSLPPSPVESPDRKLQDYAQQRSHLRSMSLTSPSLPALPPFPRSHSHSPSTSPGRTASPLATASSSSAIQVHNIPAPFAASAPGTIPNNGYTSLTLPHATYTTKNGKPLPDGKVDLVRAGRAQSSMATIEVVCGAAAALTSSPLSRSSSRFSRSFSLRLGRKSQRNRSRSQSRSRDPEKERDGATPAHLRGTLPLPVAFTAHVAPPTFVPPSHVLVQVFAVALDGLDSLMVQERSVRRGSEGSVGKASRRGFVPGRSFVGRAVECGFEVSREVCKRGEWVVGLLDVRKCGALAEFVLVERHRVFRSPQPRARPSYVFPPRRRAHARTLSLPSASHSPMLAAHQPKAPSPLAPPAPLTAEELALIPLCGIPAHRAVRTFANVLATRSGKLQERPRVLILMGHDGAGAMALQMLGRKRVHICVQIPESAVGSDDKEESSEESVKAPAFSQKAKVEARLRAWGAEEICVGEPLVVLERFMDEGRSYDAILDTVGGSVIWEASQRLLSCVPSSAATQSAPTLSGTRISTDDAPSEEQGLEEGRKKKETSYAQFTTLVGDMPSRAVPKAQDNLRSGLRSLRRAMSTGSPSKGSASSSSSRVFGTGGKSKVKRSVGYSWISIAADVDEGEDIRDSLGAVVAMVEEGKIRPWVGLGEEGEEDRVVSFESAPEAFRRGAEGPRGVLKDSGTCVVKIGA